MPAHLNDGRFPDDSAVEVRYPRSPQELYTDPAYGHGCQARSWSSAPG